MRPRKNVFVVGAPAAIESRLRVVLELRGKYRVRCVPQSSLASLGLRVMPEIPALTHCVLLWEPTEFYLQVCEQQGAMICPRIRMLPVKAEGWAEGETWMVNLLQRVKEATNWRGGFCTCVGEGVCMTAARVARASSVEARA